MSRLKRAVIWLLVAFFVYAVFRSPDQAAREYAAGKTYAPVHEVLADIEARADAFLDDLADIDPRVFDCFDSGQTIRGSLKRMVAEGDPGEFVQREKIERAVLRLLR